MTMTEGYLQDIIKLQLKKPKNWNWQLSTSKSSPHIALPIIQLYDAKGHLVFEAKDNGGTERRSWHSSQVLPPKELPTNVREGFKESTARHLQRCKSDSVDLNSTNRRRGTDTIPRRHKYESINETANNDTMKTTNATTINSRLTENANSIIEKLMVASADVLYDECGRGKPQIQPPNNAIRKGQLYHLQKSRSDLPCRESQKTKFTSRINQLFTDPLSNHHHRRTRSDDLFSRKLKYNEESIKRSELDGYRNFITPNIPLQQPTALSHEKNRIIRQQSSSSVLLDNNNSDVNGDDVNHFTTKHCHNYNNNHPRYKTRTCSAGTLIICEESFNNPRRRHRRRRQRETDSSASIEQHPNTIPTFPSYKSNDNIVLSPATSKHVRQISDPTGSKLKQKENVNKQESLRKKQIESITMRQQQNNSNNSKRCSGTGLFYSLSDVFPLENIPKEKNNNTTLNNLDIECNYIVQEPNTTTPNESRKNSSPIIEKLKKKKHRKVSRRYSNGSTSSTTSLENEKNSEQIKGHLIKDHHTKVSIKGGGGGGGGSHHCNGGDSGNANGTTDLLQLVQRLSNDQHVKMGANVSRHSAKGLSGRRSQSSGSICNGKGGRHNDGKICSSLPSYLDEQDSNGCNNNHHECEKPPLDEVERIPPLGDGAPFHWKFSDNQTVLCDQGYGSERSPEEEYPPPLPDHDSQCHHHLEPHACYPFITPESTFIVKLAKGSRGLGLSVTGGIDSNGSWPGLIRIKRLFPHQPASACGLLNVGDLLLEANGITLTGLTNYEALEVLRTAPNQVDLKVCRPPPDVLNCVSPISEVPPPPPRREPPTSLNLPSAAYSTPEDDYYHGEFEVTLTKIQGSLGFTLRKEDDSALGHYVRALVREPALTDGRIRPGDKIIAVNEVEISPMSHEQAVQFLRQCGDIVKLRLYRDSAQTPVAALSPSETTPRTSFSRKAHLRQEAVDMLNDIAVRKLIPGNQDTYRRSLSPNASPRRLRRQPCPSDASQITDSSTKYMINDNEQFHEGLLQKCSHPFDDDAFNSLFSIESDDGDKPSRPSSLDLYNPNQTPVAARKPRFNFSLAHNAYELNNLDPEVLDAPNLTYNLGNDDVKSTDVECGDSFPQEPASMPHIPHIDNTTFSYKNPAYQSAHPQCVGMENNHSKPTSSSNNTSTISSSSSSSTSKVNTSVKMSDDGCQSLKRKKSTTSNAHQTIQTDDTNQTVSHVMRMQDETEILAIELNRGWNSRLGFSLQGAAGVTYVSAVHADSVAAKDGRLKPGDRVIKVNDESVEHMSTSEIIDLLRIVRGPVCIVVSRIKSNEDCPKSNAAN